MENSNRFPQRLNTTMDMNVPCKTKSNMLFPQKSKERGRRKYVYGNLILFKFTVLSTYVPKTEYIWIY